MYCITPEVEEKDTTSDFKKVLISKDEWEKLIAISGDNFVRLQAAFCAISLDNCLSTSLCGTIGKPTDTRKLTFYNQ